MFTDQYYALSRSGSCFCDKNSNKQFQKVNAQKIQNSITQCTLNTEIIAIKENPPKVVVRDLQRYKGEGF